jgi:hypothetical protein
MKAWWSQTFLWSILAPTASSSGQHMPQVQQPLHGTRQSLAHTAVAGRLLATPLLPCPWSHTGVWEGWRCSFCSTLADAAASSATAGSDVTTSSFGTGALCELSMALVKGNEVVYREALHVYELLEVRRHVQVPQCPQWTLSSVVDVCSVVTPNVRHSFFSLLCGSLVVCSFIIPLHGVDPICLRCPGCALWLSLRWILVDACHASISDCNSSSSSASAKAGFRCCLLCGGWIVRHHLLFCDWSSSCHGAHSGP